MSDKTNKKSSRLQLQSEIEKLELITELERRMRGDLIETFKIIHGISNYSRYFFNISPRTGNLLSKKILESKSINQLYFFSLCFCFRLIELYILGTNYLIRSKTAIG